MGEPVRPLTALELFPWLPRKEALVKRGEQAICKQVLVYMLFPATAGQRTSGCFHFLFPRSGENNLTSGAAEKMVLSDRCRTLRTVPCTEWHSANGTLSPLPVTSGWDVLGGENTGWHSGNAASFSGCGFQLFQFFLKLWQSAINFSFSASGMKCVYTAVRPWSLSNSRMVSITAIPYYKYSFLLARILATAACLSVPMNLTTHRGGVTLHLSCVRWTVCGHLLTLLLLEGKVLHLTRGHS